MTNLANWQDDIEALGGDFDGSLSGLCIMSLSFDFTRSGLGGGGGGGTGGAGNGTTGLSGAGPHFGQAKQATSSDSGAASTGSLPLFHQHHSQPGSLNANNRLSSTSALSLHHHHQEVLNESSMNAFKRFKSSLLLNSGSINNEPNNNNEDQNEPDANQSETHQDDLRSALSLNGNGKSNNQKIVRQLQSQINSCLSSAASLSAGSSTLSAHYSSISLASGQQQSRLTLSAAPDETDNEPLAKQLGPGSPSKRTENMAEEHEHDEDDAEDDDDRSSSINSTPSPSAESSRSPDTSDFENNDDDDDDDDEVEENDDDDDEDDVRGDGDENDEDDDERDEDDEHDDDDEYDEEEKSAPGSPSSSVSRDGRPAKLGSCSQSASDASIERNNLQQDSQDLRINTNTAHSNGARKSGEQRARRPTAEQPFERRRRRRRRESADSRRPTLERQSSFLAKDSLVNAGTLKESSYTTSVITTTAPMHFKGLHHQQHQHQHQHHHQHHQHHHHAHAHHPPHSFSMKHTFPPSPYHQFSNSSFNHDFYDRYLSSHDSHQPLQTPLIGIERTQDLLSLKLPPHGPDTADTDSTQRFTKDWLFGGAGSGITSAGGAQLGDDRNKNAPTPQPNCQVAHDTKNDTTNLQAHAMPNDLSLSANHQGDKPKTGHSFNERHLSHNQELRPESRRGDCRRDSDDSLPAGRRKSFQFSYKSSSNTANTTRANNSSSSSSNNNNNNNHDAQQREPIDLNVSSFGKLNEDQDGDEHKSNMFDESMKHFNPNRMLSSCCSGKQSDHGNEHAHERHHQGANNEQNIAGGGNTGNGGASGPGGLGSALNMSHQYHGQESMLGLDQASKQKFQYVLAAPISVATKITEDTMTYLNQGQAYEIKLENTSDVSEVKKGFMCSIINIGFHERHMQQAENALWQQWSQQHPGERIFSVDMKLSYNVFGVESDGLNKHEFLWDSSKAAGVFIRINSISTEFTPRKHGGEKGIPFKLSIETFSYNSKTHDSYFISAACCQIKVFKPKGAERKIRSDRDKIFKRPPSELDKYHQSCDHTVFRECSLSSLHPLVADGSIGYYRHSHGHFASKQNSGTSARCTPTATVTPSGTNSQIGRMVNSQQEDINEHHNHHHRHAQNQSQENNNGTSSNSSSNNNNNNNNNENSPDSSNRKSQHPGSDSDNSRSGDYLNRTRNANDGNAPMGNRALSDYSTSRLLQATGNLSQYRAGSLDESGQHLGANAYNSSYAHQSGANSSELSLMNTFGQHHSDGLNGPSGGPNHLHPQGHANNQRTVASLASSVHVGQPFNVSYYSHHPGAPCHPHQQAAVGMLHGHIPQPPPQPPAPSVHHHANYGGLSLAAGNVPSSALVPAYQAAAAAAAVAATTRAIPGTIYRHLGIGDKPVNGQQHHSTTPFRASNLALASSHNSNNNQHNHNHHGYANSSGDHCGDTSQSQQELNNRNGNTSHQQQQQQNNHSSSSLNSYHHSIQHQPQSQQQHHSSNNHDSLNHHLDGRAHLNNNDHHNHHHPPQSSSALPQLYRQRSASTSLTNNLASAHCSSYVGSGGLNHQHQSSHNNQQSSQRLMPMNGDCYSSVNDSSTTTTNNNHSSSNLWLSSIQSSSNPGCLSRGCSSNSNCQLNSNCNNLHHHGGSGGANGGYQTGSSSYQQQQQHLHEHNNHYEHHSEQDSPHKSHNSNDSPLSCYSRYRENAPATQNDSNNTMSSYSSQQQQHYDQHQHQDDQNHQQQPHEHDQEHGQGHDQEAAQHQHHNHHHHNNHHDDHHHQEHQLESLSRSSSSLLEGLADRITTSSSCAEVLTWLLANRFGILTKTFNNFSGADLLRLSKSEMVEICGLPDGIRLFNSLHNQPIRAKRKTFRTLRFAQMKREIKIKRKLK